MKKIQSSLFSIAALLLFAGCETTEMMSGKYEPQGRATGEFAVVYHNLIFLRVQAPDNVAGALSYWDWAGKYKVNSRTGELDFDMPAADLKRWKYSFGIKAMQGGISVEDRWGSKTRYLLFQRPQLRSKYNNAPEPMNAGGVDPEYRPTGRTR